jgi:hypothetical protein
LPVSKKLVLHCSSRYKWDGCEGFERIKANARRVKKGKPSNFETLAVTGKITLD